MAVACLQSIISSLLAPAKKKRWLETVHRGIQQCNTSWNLLFSRISIFSIPSYIIIIINTDCLVSSSSIRLLLRWRREGGKKGVELVSLFMTDTYKKKGPLPGRPVTRFSLSLFRRSRKNMAIDPASKRRRKRFFFFVFFLSSSIVSCFKYYLTEKIWRALSCHDMRNIKIQPQLTSGWKVPQ